MRHMKQFTFETCTFHLLVKYFILRKKVIIISKHSNNGLYEKKIKTKRLKTKLNTNITMLIRMKMTGLVASIIKIESY